MGLVPCLSIRALGSIDYPPHGLTPDSCPCKHSSDFLPQNINAVARPQWKEAIRPRPCHCPFHLLPATSLPAALFTLDTSSGNNTAQEASLGWRVGRRGDSCSAHPGTGRLRRRGKGRGRCGGPSRPETHIQAESPPCSWWISQPPAPVALDCLGRTWGGGTASGYCLASGVVSSWPGSALASSGPGRALSL